MIHAVIFNLDGVLVRTDECHYQAWAQLAHEQGILLQPDLYVKMMGMKRMDSLRVLLKKAERDYTPSEMWALSVRKNDLFNAQVDALDQESVMPGALETVIALRNMGLKTAVASSSENAACILRQLHIDQWFDVVVDGGDVQSGKPDPEVYLTAARRLSMPTGECLVVESTPAGQASAHQAGMRCLMIRNPYGENKEQYLPAHLAELDLVSLLNSEYRIGRGN